MRSSSVCPQMNEKWNNSLGAQLNSSRGPWISERTRKIPAEPGRTKERRKRKRRGSGLGRVTQPGDESEEMSPYPGKTLTGGAQFGQKESLILCAKKTWQAACGSRTEWDLHTGCWPQPCPPSLRGMSTNADKGWVLKCGVCRADQGKGLLLAMRKHPEGMAMTEELCKQDACGEAWTTIEQSAIGEWRPNKKPIASLVPCAGLCSPRTMKNSIHVGLLAPSQGLPHPTPPQSAESCALGQLKEKTLVSWPHAQMELKAQVKPRDKEETWNLSLEQHKPWAYTHDRPCNLSLYRASESTTSALSVMAGVALAAVDFGGFYTRGVGPGQSLSFSVAPQRVQLHTQCNPRTWLHWIYAGDLAKTTSERHQGHVPSCPWLRWSKSSANTTYHESLQNAWEGTPEHTLRCTFLEEQYSVTSLPVGVLQSHLPGTTDQIHSKDSDLGALLLHPESRHHQRQGSNNHWTRGKQPWISTAGSGHSSQQSKHRSREDKSTNLWTNLIY